MIFSRTGGQIKSVLSLWPGRCGRFAVARLDTIGAPVDVFMNRAWQHGQWLYGIATDFRSLGCRSQWTNTNDSNRQTARNTSKNQMGELT